MYSSLNIQQKKKKKKVWKLPISQDEEIRELYA